MHAGTWLLAAHLIGVFLWIGAMMSVYWMQRVQSHAPTDSRDQLTAMQRSLAMMMDLAAALAIGCGIAMIVHPVNMFSLPDMGYFHAKLAIVVIGILPVHGMIRARVKKFSSGKSPAVPQWQWSMLLAAVCAIIILIVKHPF